MAETSRKRSRKTKLVPRDYAEEDDIELQIPETKISKSMKQPLNKLLKKKVVVIPLQRIFTKPKEADTSVLKKINAAAKEDKDPQSKMSPRKFEINIEVESCDDEEFADIEDENRLTPIAKDTLISKKVRTEPIELSRESILDAAENILQESTDVADKILNIHVRNTIGYEDKITLLQDCHEGRIQHALDEWRTWQFRSFHRENPLFYKCYICTRSWWHLTDFRNHLSSQHPNDLDIKIIVEKYETHEANLIAYHDKLVVILDIYTEGLCYRCGKDYAAHELEYRFEKKFYMNKGCNKKFFSCMGLRDHLVSCKVCNNQDTPLKCSICKSRFDTEEELNYHLVLSHSVRSDVPIMTQYKNCKNCLEKFSCKYLHKCKEIGPKSECPHCSQSFPNIMSLEIHMEQSKKSSKCEVCQKVIRYSCKRYEHMLAHTDNYMMLRKCMACNGLNVFLNDEDAAAHWLLKHASGYSKRKIYFPKIVVPTACVYQGLAELNLKERGSIPDEERESIPEEERESIPEEEEESKPNVEESVQKREESLLQEELIIKSEIDCGEKLLQADLESDFYTGAVVVKDEPEDFEDSPRLVIKEEPFEAFVSQMRQEENLIEDFKHEISVKEEVVEEEYEEDEEDIIKLNFNLADLFVKQEVTLEHNNDTLQQTEENNDTENNDTEDFLDAREDSVLEPEVIIGREYKRHQKLYKCTKCGFTATHGLYKSHVDYDCGGRPRKNQNYECTKCKNTFVSMKKYLTHFKEHGYQHLSCPECLKKFDTFSRLGQHVHQHIKHSFVRVKMITHAGKAMTKPDYQCKKCGIIISLPKFFEHWETHINGQPTHPIKVTSRPKHEHGELRQTIIKECIARLTTHPKECNHCHRLFKRVNECKRHMIEHLLSDAYSQKHIDHELRCQVCEQGFETAEKYKQHMRDHASLPVYKCELCDRTFSDSSNFTKHKKVHNLKVIICDLCNKKFQSKTSLEKHMVKHNNATPIPCEICNKVFFFDTAYRRHIRYNHEKSIIGVRCVICRKTFESSKVKWEHMWEVHRERRQKADCPICNQSFRKYSDVRLHARFVHKTEVTVVNVKKSAVNPNLGIGNLNDTSIIKTGRTETLIVFDSD